MAICNYCNQEFKPKRGAKGLFCSRNCHYDWKRANRHLFTKKDEDKAKYNCEYCGKEFIHRDKKKRFCCLSCSVEWRRENTWVNSDKLVTLTCACCGLEFTRYQSRQKKSTSGVYYCNRSCTRTAQSQSSFNKVDAFRFDVSSYEFQKPSNELGDYSSIAMRKRKYSCNDYLFQRGIVDEKIAYLYGLILTDGSVTQGEKSVLSFHMGETELEEKAKEILNADNPIRKYKNSYQFSVHSRTLLHDLNALGVVRNKTEICTYPLIPASLDSHFIRGVFDGDGSWVVRKRGEVYLKFFGNDLLLYGIQKKIHEHLGTLPSGLTYPIDYDKNYKMKSFCILNYNQTNSLKIRDWLYKDANWYGSRKYKLAFKGG